MTDNSMKMFLPPYLNHPRTGINLPDPIPNVLSSKQQTRIAAAKIVTAQEDHKYLGKHPEIKAIIKIILRRVFANRPDNIPHFVASLVRKEEFSVDVAELVTDQEASNGSARSDDASSDTESYDGLFAKIFAGMESMTSSDSSASKAYSSRDPTLLSRPSDIFEDFAHVENMDPENRRTSHDRRTSGQRGSVAGRQSLTRRSSVRDKWFEDQERRQSTCSPAGNGRRRATMESTGGRDETETGSIEHDWDEYYSSSSSSDSWDSDLELDFGVDSEWDINDRAMMQGQKLVFGLLAKQAAKDAWQKPDKDTPKDVTFGNDELVDMVSVDSADSDVQSLYSVAAVTKIDIVNLFMRDDEEYF